jgi:hypothetical protein
VLGSPALKSGYQPKNRVGNTDMKQFHNKARSENKNRDEQHPNKNVPIIKIKAHQERHHAANNQCNRTKSLNGLRSYHGVFEQPNDQS